jgi:putative flavoprotein involved in K+ transport
MPGSERFETMIIGAGQAGLTVGYHLARRGRPFVVLDANEQVGDNWRRHWDSLRLYSPARFDGLPGMRFPASAWSFPTKDQVADYLVAYATRYELPVRTGVRVDALWREDGQYVVAAGERRFEAEHVVVASGTFGRPYTPDFAAELDPGILQLHSSHYQRPSQLQPGGVLVVGAAHSGADIAFEVADGHQTVLSGRDTGQIPLRIESRPARAVFPVLWFVANHVLTLHTPLGRKMRPEIRAHGGPLLRYKSGDLTAAGVERVFARTVGVREGRPQLEGGRVLDVTNVIWCTGFRQDFSWIRLPVVGDDGWPREERGVVPSAPGLYFSGLAFQRAFASMLIGGAGKDAEYVATHITAGRANGRAAVPAAARAGAAGA